MQDRGSMETEAMPGVGLGTEYWHSLTSHCHQRATMLQRSLVCAPWCCGAPWGPAWSCVTPTVTALGMTSAAPPAVATSANHLRVNHQHPVGPRPLCPLPTCHCDPPRGNWKLRTELLSSGAGRAAPPPWRGALSPSPISLSTCASVARSLSPCSRA